MSKPKLRYFYRAFFKPDQNESFAGLSTGLDSWGKGIGYAQVWHKGNTASFCQNCVANEFICGEIGRFLRLPVPPFAITYRDAEESAEPLFSSLDFNFNRSKLPQVEPTKCVEYLPELSTGVLVFDLLIANSDRHAENLIVDRVERPSQMHVFDHGHALLGPIKREGIRRLGDLSNRLGITGGTVSEGRPHIFLDAITTERFFPQWLKRIYDIPKWFIFDVCDYATEIGLTKEESRAVAEFLTDRQERLTAIIDAHRAEFSITDWPAQTRLFP